MSNLDKQLFLRFVPQARQKSAGSRNVQHRWLPHSAGLLSTEFFSAERFWNAGGLHKSVVIQRYSESMCWKQELFFPPKYQKIFLTMHKNHHNLTFFTTKEKNYIKLMLKCHFSNISSERLVSALAISAAHVSIYYRRVSSSSSGQFAAVYIIVQMLKR